MKKFFSNFYNIYLIFLTVLVSLPILAPLLLHIGFETPANIIYFVYSFLCHQFSSRSIEFYDYQMAWCARDTAIWFGIFLTAWLVNFNKLPKLRWYWVLPFIVPMALDGVLQTIFTFLNLTPAGVLSGEPLYISNNLSRFMTGAIFGIGVGWWLSQQLKGLYGEKVNAAGQKVTSLAYRLRYILWTGLLVGIMFGIYVLLVQIWNNTSVEHKPLNALDSTVKSSGDLFFIRRADGACPTSGASDLFATECFFK